MRWYAFFKSPMKTLSFSFSLMLSISILAQDRDPSPSVAPTASAAVASGVQTQTTVPDPTPSVTGAAIAPNSKPIALRTVGSNVKNLKGEYLGLIEEVA